MSDWSGLYGGKASGAKGYDPFARGAFPVGVRTIEARDEARRRWFPCEIWYPAAARHAGEDVTPATRDVFPVPSRQPRSQTAVRDAEGEPGHYPLVLFSHPAGYHRRAATFLCTHLCSHGYLVAALDHSEVVAAELGRREGETSEERAVRMEQMIASRVPDLRFLLDHLLQGAVWEGGVIPDAARVGMVGHSFGGWAALAAAGADRRVRAVAALAPAGSSQPRPGILPVKLDFEWGRDVPVLYLAAEYDTPIPLTGIYEMFERTRASKRLVILRRSDHGHFMDQVEEEHEMVRGMTFSGELAWMTKEMRPIEELCSGEQGHVFTRGLTLAHMDAALRELREAREFLQGDLEGELERRGVEAAVHRTP